MMLRQFQAMAAYNTWMNERLYEAVAGLPPEDRLKDRGAFFGSIQGTLDHVLWGDRVWLGRLQNRELGAGPLGGLQHPDFAELTRERMAMDREILAFTGGLTDSWLAQDLTWLSTADGRTRTQPLWLLVTHMFNHQIHHRGQVTTLLSQSGVDVGTTDLPRMPAGRRGAPDTFSV